MNDVFEYVCVTTRVTLPSSSADVMCQAKVYTCAAGVAERSMIAAQFPPSKLGHVITSPLRIVIILEDRNGPLGKDVTEKSALF
jgi:hypothetical protein